MCETILFYGVGDDYGEFSNFAPYPIVIHKKRWPTSEHFFQAQKFDDERHREAIRKANSPMLAARMGRDRKKKLRRGWESMKVAVMREAVMAKFTQHESGCLAKEGQSNKHGMTMLCTDAMFLKTGGR